MTEAHPPRLLLRISRARGDTLAKARLGVDGTTFRVRPLTPNEDHQPSPGFAPAQRWFLAEANPAAATAAELWQLAHEALKAMPAVSGEGVYAEPDLLHPWIYENPVRPASGLGAAPEETCVADPQNPIFPIGPRQGQPEFAWHLRDDFSQLRAARQNVAGASTAPVRIGILDVGYDFTHHAMPEGLRLDLQRNFVDDGQPINDASDPFARGLGRTPGHGTGTIGILAGGRLRNMVVPSHNTGDYLGAAPLAQIVPLRVATSVILLRTSAFVEAIDYLIAPLGSVAERADVVSMSMGGLASQAWADVVNRAYEAGICLVTAAGNNYRFSPKSLVYPARFMRVIAACGVMADHRAYIRDNVPSDAMAGNFGPDSRMDWAMAAYTPNIPWPEINCPGVIDEDGCGTSSATPQVAGAAALWLQRHKPNLPYTEAWQQVEAVRRALFSSAAKDFPDRKKFFGQGVLRANQALAVQPAMNLVKTPADEVDFPVINLLTGRGIAPPAGERMLITEALQLWQSDPEIEAALPDPHLPRDQQNAEEMKTFLDAALSSPRASAALKNRLAQVYARETGRDVVSVPASVPFYPYSRTEVEVSPPACRRLRAYAFDPDLTTRLESWDISQVVLSIPWEAELEPGPMGEYVEVIDQDPASAGLYMPVNLNDPLLLATDGLAPSDSNPKFHQQFVYTVAMKTITNFECALGRRAQWAPQPDAEGKARFVRRLRIYPHALREANAYYDPDKKALLFGYFPTLGGEPGEQYPHGITFTCLSHDIVAHETTHALLDGMHREYLHPTNKDQLAFHEAIADIVAIFQHFTLREVVSHQIARTRGDLRGRNRLGELAVQFGYATGKRGALRSYIAERDPQTGDWRPLTPDPTAYARLTEPHDLGALLVAAVFDSFLAMYERRSADLVRLATGGTGILPGGAIHPDLVGRLTDEATKAAQHVLTMCLRALDYCPPLDMTFGDYLRAIITADRDLWPVDLYCYRVAFVEAFRRRGIYPKGLTTLSVDTLCWRTAREDEGAGLKGWLRPALIKLRRFAGAAERISARDKLFALTSTWERTLKDELARALNHAKDRERERLMLMLGLDVSADDPRFDVHSLRLAHKQGPYGSRLSQLIFSVVQDRALPPPGGGGGPPTQFSGGSTVIADLHGAEVTYCLSKNIRSPSRLERQQSFERTGQTDLAQVYLSAGYSSDGAGRGLDQPFAQLHADTGGLFYD